MLTTKTKSGRGIRYSLPRNSHALLVCGNIPAASVYSRLSSKAKSDCCQFPNFHDSFVRLLPTTTNYTLCKISYSFTELPSCIGYPQRAIRYAPCAGDSHVNCIIHGISLLLLPRQKNCPTHGGAKILHQPRKSQSGNKAPLLLLLR